MHPPLTFLVCYATQPPHRNTSQIGFVRFHASHRNAWTTLHFSLLAAKFILFSTTEKYCRWHF